MRVRVEAVTKIYDGRPVLAGVSAQLERGECLLVYGPNGSGKSTLLRVMATLVPPTAGRVVLDGKPAAEWGPQVRRRIGVLFHESMVYGALTAEENLVWTARLYGLRRPRDAAREALARVGLGPWGSELAGRFSRGMKQRLSLARSLLADPDLILWDEPYEGLDQRSVEALDERLRSLRDEGKTIVIVAHQWERVWPHADRVLCLRGGKVVYEGPRASIREDEWKRRVGESRGDGRAEPAGRAAPPPAVGAGRRENGHR